MKYLCFYTNKPVAAVFPIRSEELPNTKESLVSFQSKLDEVVFERESREFKLEVCRDGLLKLHVYQIESDHPIDTSRLFKMSVNWEQKWNKYLNYLNAFHVVLYSSVVSIDWGKGRSFDGVGFYEITRNDAFLSDSSEIGFEVRDVYHAGQARKVEYRYNQNAMSLLTRRDFGLSTEILQTAFEQFELVAGNQDVIQLLAELAKSLAELKQFNNTSSLVMSWFGIEKIINRMWSDLKHSPRFVSLKPQILASNTNEKGVQKPISKYTVANKIAALYAIDTLSREDFELLGICRRQRNEIAHDGSGDTPNEIAKSSNQLFIALLNKIKGKF